jgi:hypothetical protein
MTVRRHQDFALTHWAILLRMLFFAARKIKFI